jgi:hypothetical protein
MKTRRIIDLLGPVYAGLVGPQFQAVIPVEDAADCTHCPMLSSGGSGDGLFAFDRRTKCCTHYPELPNFMVGALLSSRSPASAAGRKRMLRVIRQGVGVSPWGLKRPRKYELLLLNSQLEFFGRAPALVCPFFDQPRGHCTLRPFWGKICGTWFCKHRAGLDGRLFYLALQEYLQSAESVLSQYAMVSLDCQEALLAPIALADDRLTVRELQDQPPPPRDYRKLWGRWASREADFYRAAYRLVRELDRKAFQRLGGFPQQVLADRLQARLRDMRRPEAPAVLVRNPALQVRRVGQRFVLTAYSHFDPVELSSAAYPVLDFFDGRKTNQQVCRQLRRERGQDLSPQLILQMYQARVLVEPEAQRV